MKFWDNVKKFAQPYADEEYDDYEDDDGYAEEEQAPRGRRAPAYAAPEQPAPEFEAPAYGDPAAPYANPAPAYSAPAPAPAASPYAAPAYSAPAPEQRPNSFNGNVISMNQKPQSRQEVVVFRAKTFEDAAKAAGELRNHRIVVLNMEKVESNLTRRVVDFLSGAVYALDGKAQPISQFTYLFCPNGMEIIGELEAYTTAAADNYI